MWQKAGRCELPMEREGFSLARLTCSWMCLFTGCWCVHVSMCRLGDGWERDARWRCCNGKQSKPHSSQSCTRHFQISRHQDIAIKILLVAPLRCGLCVDGDISPPLTRDPLPWGMLVWIYAHALYIYKMTHFYMNSIPSAALMLDCFPVACPVTEGFRSPTQ